MAANLAIPTPTAVPIPKPVEPIGGVLASFLDLVASPFAWLFGGALEQWQVGYEILGGGILLLIAGIVTLIKGRMVIATILLLAFLVVGISGFLVMIGDPAFQSGFAREFGIAGS